MRYYLDMDNDSIETTESESPSEGSQVSTTKDSSSQEGQNASSSAEEVADTNAGSAKTDADISQTKEPTSPAPTKEIEVDKNPQINLSTEAASENADSVDASKKPKNKAWRIILIVIIAIVVIIAVTVIFLLTTINKKKEPSTTLSKSLTSLENSYKGKTIAFAFPASPQGWKAEVFGDNGIYKYKNNSNTCQVTFQQNKGVTAAVNSGLTLDADINSVIDGTSKLLTKNDLKVGSTGTHAYTASDGKQIDFVTRQATYTGNDGVPYTIEVAGQWIGDYEFIVISACSTSDWNKSIDILNDFTKKVSLNIS